VADLDSLARSYNLYYEKEAMAIGLLLVSRGNYSIDAMIGFWSRLENSDAYSGQKIRLIRNLSPAERVAIIEEIVPNISEWTGKTATK